MPRFDLLKEMAKEAGALIEDAAPDIVADLESQAGAPLTGDQIRAAKLEIARALEEALNKAGA